ncbi:MAG: glucuronate isomerase [Lachnospiraceae bacterium]
MKQFMDKDFLLSNEVAKHLFHMYASKTPVLDYHCHINPEEIANDRHFDNITQIWLGGDHYKWRYMRSCGVDEHYITGDASDKEKFLMWAKVLGKAIGNPLYHWSHLELQRYFNFHGYLHEKNAEEVWNLCNDILRQETTSARSIIKNSNVTLICTTDDPIDSLMHHKAIAMDSSFDVHVLPTFRPDKAMNLEKTDYLEYLEKLSTASSVTITSFSKLKEAITERVTHFKENGCLISDHGLDFVMYEEYSDEEINAIFNKRLRYEPLSKLEIYKYKTAFMMFVGELYAKNDWTMQLHYGVKRDNNTSRFETQGPDTGYDCISNYAPSDQLANFLNALNNRSSLPRTILYSLNPIDNAVIGTILGCFQDSSTVSKIQHGSAWWFNDHKQGMQDQLISLANLGNLSGFVGMLTDSRSFLSYTRHEYFRRILCNFIGELVENGEYPNDEHLLEELVTGISYQNAIKYFKLPL